MPTKNQPENVFINRLYQIPLVNALCLTVLSVYQTTKHSNKLFETPLDKVENILKVANKQVEPLKQLVDRPVSTVSEIADHQLAQLQCRFPVINTKPDELKEYGYGVYERTGAKRIADNVIGARNQSIQKINSAKAQLVSILSVDGLLNVIDNFVDNYVTSPEYKKRPCTPTINVNYTAARVQCIIKKVGNGAQYRTAVGYKKLKKYASDYMEIIESASIYLAKAISNTVAQVSDRVLSSATPYLPEGMEKAAASLVSYSYHWQERIQQTTTAGDVWKVSTEEAKRTLRLAREFVQSILNNNDLDSKNDKRW